MKEQGDAKYFFDPPVNKCTMNFLDPDAEQSYRDHTAKDFLSPDAFQVGAVWCSSFTLFLYTMGFVLQSIKYAVDLPETR